MAGLERDAAPGDSEARGSDGSESGSLAGADEEEEEDLLSPAGSVSSLRRQARSEGFAIAGTPNLAWTLWSMVGNGYGGVLTRIRVRARIRVDTLNLDVYGYVRAGPDPSQGTVPRYGEFGLNELNTSKPDTAGTVCLGYGGSISSGARSSMRTF